MLPLRIKTAEQAHARECRHEAHTRYGWSEKITEQENKTQQKEPALVCVVLGGLCSLRLLAGGWSNEVEQNRKERKKRWLGRRAAGNNNDDDKTNCSVSHIASFLLLCMRSCSLQAIPRPEQRRGTRRRKQLALSLSLSLSFSLRCLIVVRSFAARPVRQSVRPPVSQSVARRLRRCRETATVCLIVVPYRWREESRRPPVQKLPDLTNFCARSTGTDQLYRPLQPHSR